MKKALLILIGLVATGVAFIGVITPGLPTTPFLIVALWAFASSNKKLHTWLLNRPLFQSAISEIHQFKKDKTVTKKVKAIAQLCAWGSFILMLTLYGINHSITLSILVAATLCSLTMFILKSPQ